MKALVLGSRKAWMEEVPKPEPEPGWPVIRTTLLPICGSDRGAFLTDGEHRWAGHEGVGVIEEVAGESRFRPGDRVQFPSLNLVGDVKDIGAMYTMLDQVGGTIGSEEPVGRYILVPNAMLFSQVVINYTVKQEAAYMLDEVVIRITYDSDWEAAEQILVEAATEVTGDLIQATGVKPYIRSDWYDYGVYLRLRYLTRVKERVELAYKIQKMIFEGIQHSPSVDMAIPYVYSYRASMDRREEVAPPDQEAGNVREIDISRIQPGDYPVDAQDVELLAKSVAAQGLLQPIVVLRNPQSGQYEILAGHLRYEACKRLGWESVPAVVREYPARSNNK